VSNHPEWVYDYLLGKIGEIDDALAAIDRAPEPIVLGDVRAKLVELQAQYLAAVAAADAEPTSLS
jgi:hypothetical protein